MLARATLLNTDFDPGAIFGTVMEVSISPGASTVLPGPKKKSTSGTSLSPSRPDMWATASTDSKPTALSAHGDALQMFPPTVARFLIWTEPSTFAASWRMGYSSLIRAHFSISRILVNAPISMPSGVSLMPDSPGIFFRLTMCFGLLEPSFILTMISVPPASAAASLPSSFRSFEAS